MTSNLQILSDLRLAMDMKQPLELMVIYKGVPVISKARIDRIESDTVVMTTQDPGLVCLRDRPQTSILGSDYFEPSTAKIQKVDLQTGEVHLREFSYLGNRLGERMIIRVEPPEPLPLTLDLSDHQIQAELVDISVSGAGIRMLERDYSPALRPGSQVRCQFELPTGGVALPATILSGIRSGDSHRLSVRFGQNGDQKKVIFRYLVDRRAEIEREIQTAFERLHPEGS